MASLEMQHFSHKVGVNVHHLEWCTKYRYKMLRQDKYKNDCENAIRQQADRHGIAIRELFVMPEHVHISCELPPCMSQSKALQLLKGGSSYLLFRATAEISAALPPRPFLESRRLCRKRRIHHGGRRRPLRQKSGRHPPTKTSRLHQKPRTLVRGGGHCKIYCTL